MHQDDNSTEEGVPRERKEPRPDFSKPLPSRKLPSSLQGTLDDDEKLWDALYEGSGPDSTESNARYAAYAARARTILRAAHRYIAYTSDIGESFRPVAHPYLVKGAYGISWAYLIGDVSNEGYKAYTHNQATLRAQKEREDTTVLAKPSISIPPATISPSATATDTALAASKDLINPTPITISPLEDYRTVMAQRAIFQTLASMGLPAFTIHSIVRYSGKALKDVKNTRIRSYGPIGLGLAAVPFLPFLFDKPVEEAVEWTFHRGFEAFGRGTPEGVEGKKEL
ncbi:MAG: hypothetical protein M1828_005972 [Chrysothrix sp. TS-e1954]|nr:MAG: hypothetical protein M1828_005972 [Chrysothrix sp. TS-e1954]